jgi:hypothetical protein
MNRIKAVWINYCAQAPGKDKARKGKDGHWEELPGCEKVELSIENQKATATFSIASPPKTKTAYVLQTAFVNGEGNAHFTEVGTFHVTVASAAPSGGKTVASGPTPATVDRALPAPRQLFQQQSWEYLSDLQEFDVKSGPWPVSKNGDLGNPEHRTIQVDGVQSPKGLSMHPPDGHYASVKYRPGKQASVFQAQVALNDSTTFVPAAAVFEVWGDGKRLWQSNPIKEPKRPQECRVDVAGVDVLELRVNATGSHFGLHAVWVEPRVLRDADSRQPPTLAPARAAPSPPPKRPDETDLAPPKPADGLSMNELNRFPERFLDKPVSVKAWLHWAYVGRGTVIELQVVNDNKVRPTNLYFTTTRDLATQWVDNMPRTEQPYRVILTAKYDQQKNGGTYTFKVVKIQVLDAQDKVVKAFE